MSIVVRYLQIAFCVCGVIALNDVSADAPIAFDDWIVSNGRIDANCPSGFSCSDTIREHGFLQRRVEDNASGAEYIQLILDSRDTQGNRLIDESFIGMTSAQSGLAAKQELFNAGIGQSSSRMLVGWADDAVNSTITLNDNFSSTYQGVILDSAFQYQSDRDALGQQVSLFLNIDQTVTNSTRISNIVATGRDVQRYVFRRAAGSAVPTSGVLTLPSVAGGMLGEMGVGMNAQGAGGSLGWSANDDVSITWVGLLCEGCVQPNGMGGNMVSNDTTFSYQMVDNNNDVLDPVSTASIRQLDPFAWANPPFGPVPTF